MNNYKLAFFEISKKKESKDYDVDFYLTTDTKYTIYDFKNLTHSEKLHTCISEINYNNPNSCFPSDITSSGYFLKKIENNEKDSVLQLVGTCLMQILQKYNIEVDILTSKPQTFIVKISEPNSFEIEEVD